MARSGRRPLSARRKRGLIRLGIAVTALAFVFVVASVAAAEYTSRDSFCHSCHEMDPYFTSRQASAHRGRAACKDCHIPHGPVSFLRTKVFSLREVYVHVTGQVKMPLTVTRRVPDGNCTSCHESPGKVSVAGSAFDHAVHTENCVTCHARVAHRQVPVAADYPASVKDPATMAGCLQCHDGARAAAACATCHTAPHVAMGACDRCHGLKDWTPGAFDHPFALTGAHARLTCARCHPKDAKAGRIAGTDLGKADKRCASCHKAPHAAYGECNSCHAATAWTKLTFAHPSSILAGKHASVACTRCHPRDAEGRPAQRNDAGQGPDHLPGLPRRPPWGPA